MIGALYIIAVLTTAYLSYCLYKAYSLAYTLSHPKRLKYYMDTGVPCTVRRFDFNTWDRKTLKGIDILPAEKNIGTLLVCHYLGGSKESILPFVDCLIKAGFRIIGFDFRNHGESQSDHKIKFNLENDFYSFYEKVQEMGIKGPLGIMGFSMGATPVIMGLNKYPQIRAAVVDSGPLILVKEYFAYVLKDRMIKNPFVKWFFVMIFLYYAGFIRMSENTINMLKSLHNKPIFFIHGDKDNIIPLENAQAALRFLDPLYSTLWKISGSRHLTNRFLRKDEYEQRVIQFFITQLGITEEKI